MTDRSTWIESAAAGGVVPLVAECVLDADQPVAVLAKVASGPFAFLLESAVGGERWARYTFLGTEPREAWRYRGRTIERWTREAGWRAAGETTDPIGHIGDLMRARTAAPVPDLPFFGGAVGYLGYDVVRTLERLPKGPPDDAGLPDALFLVTDLVLVLDNLLNRARIVAAVEVARDTSKEERGRSYDAARAKLDAWMARLRAPSRLSPLASGVTAEPAATTSPYPGADYERDVAKLKEHIAAGDIFQAVLSRRMEVAGAVDPL
ncbi:MAG: anthranilate synthase component I, partial [Gemmatimonadales bacterium]